MPAKKPYSIDRQALLLLAIKYVAAHEEAYWTEFTAENKKFVPEGVVQQGFLNHVKEEYAANNVGRKELTLSSLKSRMTRAVKLMILQIPAKVEDRADDVAVPHLKKWLVNAPKAAKVEEPEFDWDAIRDELKDAGLVGWERIDGGTLPS